ncbi:uncharacterized protein LOC129925000 [Biomphalaria glabrata]|uniref:Uncharacterized protein LOC129925000 n=1 Tax=Biomphalaria glabrata TaxID=6526 RepID=A0A9W2ZUY6_BIOGL|nr:uncharacterized protein LOC129925000 [Biomphalaria glabrata]
MNIGNVQHGDKIVLNGKKKRNHFAAKCINTIRIQDPAESDNEDYLNTLNALNAPSDKMTAVFLINDQNVRFQLNTGADVNIICKRFVRKSQVRKTSQTLTMWNQSKLKPSGMTDIIMTNPKKGKQEKVLFTVVDNGLQCLLGLQTCKCLGLITVNNENFIAPVHCEESNLGDLGKAHLTVDETVAPVVSQCRKSPHTMREKVKKEIELLVSRKILVPVDKPTDWVSQMALVKKPNGNLRICIDPQHLNKALKLEHYKLPTLEDILPQFKNAKIFSKLDIKEAYWHIRLDESSSWLTTMITAFGRFRWARLPFGLNVSGEMFQEKLSQALERLDGCINVTNCIVLARTAREGLSQ